MTKEADVASMVDETCELGGLDGLVLNVGIGAGGAVARRHDGRKRGTRCSPSIMRSHMLTREAAHAENGGCIAIVFISSIAGLTAGSRLPAYDASKAGLSGFAAMSRSKARAARSAPMWWRRD